ncbi:uncharacterized protein LOC133780960 [Humulus lupulus]|uniref:uncharacterized protein LOC133780960 n=1 Tax=Humulus lupulus TaxID=3486 RepID=UPI002B406CD5|nr:uncharacterized protein LOC133780960 [Humulus lupulus]
MQRNMINGSLRNIISPPLPTSTLFGRKASVIGLRQATAHSASREPDHHSDMDKGKEENTNDKAGDAMSRSFGEAYSTRCDEEGFGGTYGHKQSFKSQNDRVIDDQQNHSEYDKTQGSVSDEVKEKEKSLHQTGPNRQ